MTLHCLEYASSTCERNQFTMKYYFKIIVVNFLHADWLKSFENGANETLRAPGCIKTTKNNKKIFGLPNSLSTAHCQYRSRLALEVFR